MSRILSETHEPVQRALLVGVDAYGETWAVRDSLEELARLAETVDVEVVGSLTQKLTHPHPSTYVGKGKIEEIKALKESLEYDVVLVDDELTPAQLRNLEKLLDVVVIDRTALILDVFARRAQTHEGRMQVELAQLEYRLPRLTRMWTHLSRQTKGGVGVRGPGETQLESDRREAGKRIAHIKSELNEVHRHRELYRDHRREKLVPVVSLVGYTNAGKSTLLNAMTGSSVLSEDKLFATLDPTTRRTRLASGREVLLTDTVGFINNLPTTLIAAFRATLEEINDAAVLVHVVDVTHLNAAEQVGTVNEVLEELGADGKPVVMALNKVDRVDQLGGVTLEELKSKLDLPEHVVAVSAMTGEGFDELRATVEALLDVEQDFVPVTVHIPYDRADLVNRFHRVGRVDRTDFDERGTIIDGQLPAAMVGSFGSFVAVRGSARQAEPALASSDQTAPESAA